MLDLFKLSIFTDNIEASEVFDATLNDKKMDSGVIKFILIDEIGNAFISKNVSKEEIMTGIKRIIVNEK
jgi:3-dehydroquinate synthase